MKRTLNLALRLALLMILVPDVGVSAISSDDGNKPIYATGLIWDSLEIIEENLREDPLSVVDSILPTSVDLESEFPTPRDQGNQNSCVPWAVAYALRSHQEEIKQNWGIHTDDHLFSPAYVFNQINSGLGGGSRISDAMDLLVDQGVSTIASFPYNKFDYLTQPTMEQKAEAAYFRVADYYTIRGIDSIKRRLVDGDGVVVGIDIFSDFNSLSPSNPIYDVVSGDSGGGHAVCLIGYDDARNAFKFINSWGAGWGLGGYGWISYDLIDDTRVNHHGASVGYVMDARDDAIINYEAPFDYTVSDGKTSIIRYLGFGGDVIIPDTLGGYPVTAVGEGAFQNNKALTDIVIPESVTEIGEKAFFNCTSLTSVVIPDSVKKMGERAFAGCEAIISVVIGNGVTEISSGMFYFCKALTNVVIPNSVTSIDSSAFNYCTSLNSIVIPDSVTSIGSSAFSSCTSLSSVVIPDGVTSIGSSAFSGCTSLTSVDIPDSMTSIGDRAFSFCSSLINVVFPNSITKIEDGTFISCTSLTNVVIPEKVTEIGEWAFFYCTSLTNVVIPDSVTSIAMETFKECRSLTSIAITDSVVTIGDSAFYECIGLTDLVIGNGVTLIGDSAFQNCTSLISVIIPDSVVTISAYTFSDCIRLTSVIIGNGVTSIGSSAFVNCTSLASVVIPESVTMIGSSAFYDCRGLTGLIIGNSVMSIGSLAFRNCTLLTSVIIPESVVTIGNSAFSSCTGLTNVIIGNGATSIGLGTFANTSLTSIIIPESVITIGRSVFSGCKLLTDITVDEDNPTYTSVDGILFDKNLETIILYPEGKVGAYTIPNNVTAIGVGAFTDCTALTSVVIPDSVVTIGDSAFYGCTELTSIIIGNGVVSIEDSAFQYCMALTSVTIPSSVTSIGWSAFHYIDNAPGAPNFIPLPNLTIHCYENSYAHEFAMENEIPFLIIEDSETYTVTVNGGMGSGDYIENAPVTITADTPESGKRFKEWDITPDVTFTGGGKTTATATFIMPAETVTATAVYEDIPGLPSVTYAVMVNEGTGGGDYAEHVQVTITANEPESGKQFKEWDITPDVTFTDGGKTTAAATFIMPAEAVTATAIYEDIPIETYTVTVNGGTGGGTYYAGDTVTVSFTESNNHFIEWNISPETPFIDGTSKTSQTIKFIMPAHNVSVTAITGPMPSVPVTSISGIPTSMTTGSTVALNGIINPTHATNKTIIWSVKNSGGTGAYLNGNTLSASAAGTITLTATIANGLSESQNYTQDFYIAVNASSRAIGGNGGGGGGSGAGGVIYNNDVSVSKKAPTYETLTASKAEAAAAKAIKSTSGTKVNLKFNNVSVFTKEAADAINKLSTESGVKAYIIADNRATDNSVDVRVTVNAGKVTKDLNLYGSSNDATTAKIKKKFEKFYNNKFTIVNLEQKGMYNQTVKIAVKVDYKSASHLRLYSYNAATNKYTLIKNANTKLDKNGYLHFETISGGIIIVSEGSFSKG